MRMLKKQPKFKIISLLLLISILIQIVMPLTTLAAGLILAGATIVFIKKRILVK